MTWLYSGIILLGSCLLFLVQPMCAKMLLPLLGGTPAVWNTCMVFFQAGLLAGYAYVHWLPRWIGIGPHGYLHVGLLFVASYFFLPITLPEEVSDGWHPVVWLLVSLTMSVGLPFVLLAATAPLMQIWFVCHNRELPRDPYFLYAASNLGSFLALGLFPFVMEPFLTLSEQSEAWSLALRCLGAPVILCFAVTLGQSEFHIAPPPSSPAQSTSVWQRARWIALALIPSSLLLSVTTHLTTDVASIPLLWLLPLGLYLLTFTLVFAQRQWLPHAVVLRWLPLVVIVLAIVMLAESPHPMPIVMGVHLVGFFWLALACHGELSRTRPPAQQLTDFYLCLATGGVLGGAFAALLAPLIFSGLFEYPLMIVLVCAFAVQDATRPTRDDWLWGAGLGAATVALVLTFQVPSLFPLTPGPTSVAAMFGVPLLVCYTLKDHSARFALAIAAVLGASALYHGVHGASAYRERSYFGIHRVTVVGKFHQLIHGNTVHGQQSRDPEERAEPLTYYSRSGPIGDVFRILKDDRRLKRVGVVGLGTGSVAAYSQPGQEWTFFEIDPSVKRIAENPRLFTYLNDMQGSRTIEIGDARLQLRKSRATFGLLIIDAFGSDAIPVHLLTSEALAIYLDRLEPDGILAFHISNRYVDLEPVVANLAAAAKPPCAALFRKHSPDKDQEKRGIMSSEWLVLARRAGDAKMFGNSLWQAARTRRDLRVWTDDASNLFQVFRWGDAD